MNFGHCGNGVVEPSDGEECDDHNLGNGDGCGEQCRVENGWVCSGGGPASSDTCSRIMTGDVCGNGEIGGFEQCDDGNTVFYPPDGCG